MSENNVGTIPGDELSVLDDSTLDFLRQKLAPLYDTIDRICDEKDFPRPPRF